MEEEIKALYHEREESSKREVILRQRLEKTETALRKMEADEISRRQSSQAGKQNRKKLPTADTEPPTSSDSLQMRLEVLHESMARLENDKTSLENRNLKLSETLQEVERERRSLRRELNKIRGHPSPRSKDKSLELQEISDSSTYQQRVAELERQISVLKSQLEAERSHRSRYIQRCSRTTDDLLHLRHDLNRSLAAVTSDTRAPVLERETMRLDDTLSRSLGLSTP
ncbi:centrosome-associated protein CEP250-like [Lithobates pipiens]